jgi:hypothetical protein
MTDIPEVNIKRNGIILSPGTMDILNTLISHKLNMTFIKTGITVSVHTNSALIKSVKFTANITFATATAIHGLLRNRGLGGVIHVSKQGDSYLSKRNSVLVE